MKNIHVLPTQNPSRLYKNISEELSFTSIEFTQQKNGFNINQNIYITNDEEIKEGDWVTNGKINAINCYIDWWVDFVKRDNNKFPYKKIILTTDQDLIKDGVQSIDDEFLEWFVKNPSCENVTVLQKGTTTIIFPTPKSDIISNFIKKEEPIQEILENLENQLKKVIKEHPIDVNEDTYWRGVKIGLQTAIEVIKFKVW